MRYKLLGAGRDVSAREAAKDGIVVCYARNDHLEFNIPYELYGMQQVYEPDFLVTLVNGVTLVLEIKGQPYEDTEAKHQAARRWVSAVNHWGRLGTWDFLVCREPQLLGERVKELITMNKARLKALAAELQVRLSKRLNG